jgi:monomeric sarcosine oxidase
MNNNNFDVIVLGLGVMGTAAAYHLAKDGQRVLGLEQFDLDHKLGSSYGESRIIRYAYNNPIHVEMSKAAFPTWRALEAESGKQLMFRTGSLDFGPAESPSLNTTYQTMRAAGITCEWLSGAEAMARFPQFRFDESMRAIYQPDGAYLAASRCVLTQAELARAHGATLLTNAKVLRVEVFIDSVRVHTADAQYEAARLIISAGAWGPQILHTLGLDLPLTPTREELVFLEPPDMRAFMPERLPVFIQHETPWHYGLPNAEGAGLKVAIHMRDEPTDPDNTRRTGDEDYVEHMRAFVRRYLPGGDGPVKEVRICLYTVAPDEHFIIDQHPAHPNVIIASPCSGHGFKFGNLIGRILADLATQGKTDHDISLFSVKRFL